jgi:arginyl-tRNA synthetase
LYVVDTAQSLHFKQDFTVAKALGYAEDTQRAHLIWLNEFADAAMSSRKGT